MGPPASDAGTGGTRCGARRASQLQLRCQARVRGRVSWPRTLGSASRPSSWVLPSPFLEGPLCVPVQGSLDSTKNHCWVYRVLLSKTMVVLTERLSLDLRIMG